MSLVVLGRGAEPHQVNVMYRASGDIIATVKNGLLSFSKDVSNDLKIDILQTLDFWKIRVSR